MAGYSRFSDSTLDEIRRRVSLSELVRAHATGLKRKGRDLWACCPFHQEKTPSFHVREDQGFYHCFGCGAHGDAFTFMKEMRGGSFAEAVEYLAGIAGVQLEKQVADPVREKKRTDGLQALTEATKFFAGNLKGEALEYIHKRGLSQETVDTFQIGWVADDWRTLADHLVQQNFTPDILRETGLTIASDKGRDDYDRFRGRIMFPIHSLKDEVVAFGGRIIGAGEPKYLNSPETPFFSKSHTLFNLNRARGHIRKADRALIVEGYMDVIALWQAGIQTAVAPLGTALTETQVQLLWRYHEAPVVCLDGDEAGVNAARRAARRILGVLQPGRTLQFVWLPKGHDPDSFVRERGTEALEDLLKRPAGLEEVLWASLTEGKSLNNAQARAQVDKGIEELAGEIKDEIVRRAYRRSLKDRLWSAGRTQVKAFRRTANEELKPGKRARVLLALVLRNPAFLSRVDEQFARIDYTYPAEKKLQQTIFQLYAGKGLERGRLEAYLVECGLSETAADVLAEAAHHLPNDESEWAGFWQALFEEEMRLQTHNGRKKAAMALMEEDMEAGFKAYKQIVEVGSGTTGGSTDSKR